VGIDISYRRWNDQGRMLNMLEYRSKKVQGAAIGIWESSSFEITDGDRMTFQSGDDWADSLAAETASYAILTIGPQDRSLQVVHHAHRLPDTQDQIIVEWTTVSSDNDCADLFQQASFKVGSPLYTFLKRTNLDDVRSFQESH
jgi:hypothetical protein